MSKYGVISGPCFTVFNPNAGKYGPEITPYLDTFHAVISDISFDNVCISPRYIRLAPLYSSLIY